jgi:polar amino acid transport system substrate-binding protein
MRTTTRLPGLLLLILSTLAFSSLQAAENSSLTRIQERGALVLGTSGNMPTMSQVDASGRVSGFDIDLARVMADMMGVRLDIELLPFEQLLPALESRKVDVVMSNMTITPERNLRVAFVGPYIVSGKCIVTKDRALATVEPSQDINQAETRVAVLRGSTSEQVARQLLPDATLVEVDDYAKAVQMVADDAVNGMLTDYPICLATLKTNPDAGFASIFSLLTYEPIGIALPPGDAQFINWTRNFLQRMQGTKGIEEFSQRWFGSKTLAR